MAKTVAIGVQDYAKLIENDCFYIDKTAFIRQWWNSKDDVTLITRPRRFGKTLKSNRESGYGRYDVVKEPKDIKDPAIIIEFKVFDTYDEEESLEDTAANALKQIEKKKYDIDLLQRGIPGENILKYGFAFEGEKCLIRKADFEAV